MTPPNKHAIPNEPSRTVLLMVGATGVLLLFSTLVWSAYVSYFQPETYGEIWQTLLLHLVGGRMASAEIGLGMEMNFWELAALMAVLDSIMMLLSYCIFAGGYRLAEGLPVVGQVLVNFHAAVATQARRLKRYGVLGLFIFVALPFMSTGPLAGSTIGYLLGFRTSVTLSVVTSGNVVGILAWTSVWGELRQMSPWLSWSLFLLIVAIIIYGLVRGLYNYMLRLNEPPPPTPS